MNSQQKDEIEGLESIYPESLTKISRSMYQLEIPESNISLNFTLPKSYPEKDPPKIDSLKIKNLSKVNELKLLKECRNYVNELRGEECMFDLVQFITDHEILEKSIEEEEEDEEEESKDTILAGCWFHHIQNPKKKKEIIGQVRNNSLTGIYKWGKPGYVLLYGRRENCNSWIKYIKNLHWKKMTVRFRRDFFQEKQLFTGFFEVSSETEFRKELANRKIENIFELLTHMNNNPFKSEVETVPKSIEKKTNSKNSSIHEILIKCHVSPNSKESQITSIDDQFVHISLSKPPKNNMANLELISVISKTLGVKKSSCSLIGGKSRNKTILISSLNVISVSEIFQKLKNSM